MCEIGLDEPLFDGSSIGTQRFCNDLLSIAETYELSDKACSDLLNLVTRMAPSHSFNNTPESMEDLQEMFYYGRYFTPPLHIEETITPIDDGIQKLPIQKGQQTNQHKKTWTKPMNRSSSWHDETNCTIGSSECQMPFNTPATRLHETRGIEGKSEILDQVIGSLNRLSKDVCSLKQQYSNGNIAEAALVHGENEMKTKQKRIGMRKQDIDRRRPRFFVKVFDEYNKIVPICDLDVDGLTRTVRISREDKSLQITYKDSDLTTRILHKLDISLHLHNPSYCGRAVADALFNPEFLSQYHILAEDQSTSRSNRKILAPELTRIFYVCFSYSLRKLGASRIVEEDQHSWIEQARDAVNQRNRDIKIPGCRRKFFQNSDPIFNY